MPDIVSESRRSYIMSKVPQKDSKQEILVRKYLFSKGFRFRKNVKSLPGSPDIVLPKYKIVIFVNGCYWHGHHCKAARLPDTRREFWTNKIETNIERDRSNNEKLENSGWKVLVVWQCELKSKIAHVTLEKLVKDIVG